MDYFIKQSESLKRHPLDIQFANMLVTTVFSSYNNYNEIKKIVLFLASVYLSASVRAGNTCLPICLLSSKKLFPNYFLKLTNKEIQKIQQLTIDDWQDILFSLPTTGNGSVVSPLVLNNKCLYLYRMWEDECIVAQFLKKKYNKLGSSQKAKIIDILNKLFSKKSTEINWHKITTALSLIHSTIFISGGPGTGKTSVVSKIITALLLYDNSLRIQTAASTGKASAILNYSCRNIINSLKEFNYSYKEKFILKTSTLHSLLGSRLYQAKNKNYFFENKLNLNCLIIDEASMISLSILSKLILSLPHYTKVIFLGDHHQLYSIEPGSVFQDICRYSNFNYSSRQQHELIELTGYIINNFKLPPYYNHITDKISILKKNYRFKKNSGIGQLADSVKSGDYNRSLSILSSKLYTDLSYIRITEKKDYIYMIKNCTKQYYKYLKILKKNPKSIINILQVFNDYKILCALRHGSFGVIQLNCYIEYMLNHAGLIILNRSKNYVGKPIIILCNEASLGLCNGDTGILLPNAQNGLSAYFLDPTNDVKIIQIHQLPRYETCFAMTVHKAQGSEFQKIAIILPNKHLPILTREWIYTAITRTYYSIVLYANDDVLIQSIKNVTKRYSGLYDKIKQHSHI